MLREGLGGAKRCSETLMPGLINAHHHSGLLRGTAEQLPVWEWLRLHIDPMHRVLREEEAEAAAWLCYAEGLLSGTTTVVDMWRFMGGAARAASALGNRLVSVNYVGAHPDFDYFDTLDDNERMLQEWSGAQGWPLEEQQRVALMITAENARRVYRLERVPTTTHGRSA